MMDKDMALPLITKGTLTRLQVAQRDADWERIKPLVELMQAWLPILQDDHDALISPFVAKIAERLAELGIEVQS